MTDPFQPTLPAEVPLLDVERQFMANSPPGLWPENQDSNFGQFRRVICEELQISADQLTTIYNEIFPDSSDSYLAAWEEQLDLPLNPVGKSLEQRRAIVLSRLRYGVFTRDLRATVIEDMLKPTFGDPLRLTPDGLALDVAGLPLSGETLSVAQLYRVYEDIRNFVYKVRISSSNAIDTATLARSLARLTPGGVSFSIENTLPQILHYGEMMLDANPILLLRMGSALTDASGFAQVIGTPSAPALVASPGLLNDQLLGLDEARDFNGTTNYLTATENVVVPGVSLFTFTEDWTIEFIFRPDTLPPAGVGRRIFSKGANQIDLYHFSDGKLYLQVQNTPVASMGNTSIVLAAATKYHVVISKKRGQGPRFYVNGADVTQNSADVPVTPNAIDMNIGRLYTGVANSFLDGVLDEFAIYNYPLTIDDAVMHYRTSIGLP